MFIEHALVDGDWAHPATASSPPTAGCSTRCAALEDRTRRRDLLVDRRAAGRVLRRSGSAADVVSARHFDRWWKDGAPARRPTCSTFTLDDLVEPDADPVDADAFPTTWRQGDAGAST